jgi:Domain of unknown function (DUF1883)/TIR domain
VSQFTHYNLGQMRAGQIVEVTLSSGANVRLMDSSNFNSYKNGRNHRYLGGLVDRSPYRLQIPRSGSWHITVDVVGLRNGTRSSIRTLPGALPRAASEAPLSSVPSLVRDELDVPPGTSDSAMSYDVFISHASEDKDSLVRPLAHSLKAGGLNVWYDEFELKLGDSLRRKIDAGLARSRFGIVVLSKTFLTKGWTQYELDGLVTKSVGGEQVLLPLWHGVTKQEVVDFSPSLADKVARNTSSFTIGEIADEIIDLINNY